ncbi:hypothetical protein VP01_14489g1, partial [Puccinia sorghi]
SSRNQEDRRSNIVNQSGGLKCRSGFHNPKQDNNHSSDKCWHLHPDIAPE